MITRILAALTLSLGALLVVPLAPAQAAAAVVVVDNDAFQPGTTTVRIGKNVVWKFEDEHQHTTTSDQGFWNSGTKAAGERYDRRFTSAGRYAYHCEIHPGMRGSVKVRMTADGSAAQGWTVAWSTTTAPAGRNFDVQSKRKGASSWSPLRTDTAKPDGRFNPKRDGTYLLRARTSNTDLGQSSGWSPVKSLKIS